MKFLARARFAGAAEDGVAETVRKLFLRWTITAMALKFLMLRQPLKIKLIPIQICLLCMTMLPVALQAQFTFTTNDDNTITITGYTGSNGLVTIPGTINGLSVTSLGNWAFYATSVTNVLIPDSVINIGDGAFFDCESLTNVTLGSSVTSIGDWAFGFCSSLMSVNCRGNAPSLGGDNVFYGNLATIYYLSGTTNWGPTFDGHPAVLWNPPEPFTYTTNSDGITLTITGYTGSDEAITIPNNINFLPVTMVGDYAFNNSASPTSIIIPNGVVSIGYAAFFYCGSLTNITISDSVTNIGYAFDSCFNLTSITVATNNPAFSSLAGVLFNQDQTLLVNFPAGKTGSYTIPNTVTEIGGTFSGRRVTSITIPNSVTNIPDDFCYYCLDLTNVAIPDSVTSIGSEAFTYCTSLAKVTIPKSVASMGYYAFSYCSSLTYVTIANGVTMLGTYAFDYCTNLTSVVIPNSVTNLGFDTFANCSSLTNVMIPNSVTFIGDSVFANCTHLAGVTIPSSVAGIGDNTFSGCISLKGVFFNGNAPSFPSSDVFYNTPDVTVYYLPGTTSWDTMFAGRPTALWLLPNPTILNFEPNFGVQTNRFGFTISWATNISVVVEACTNLSNPDWQPVQTNALTSGSAYFSDSQWTNYSSRFYRLRSP